MLARRRRRSRHYAKKSGSSGVNMVGQKVVTRKPGKMYFVSKAGILGEANMNTKGGKKGRTVCRTKKAKKAPKRRAKKSAKRTARKAPKRRAKRTAKRRPTTAALLKKHAKALKEINSARRRAKARRRSR